MTVRRLTPRLWTCAAQHRSVVAPAHVATINPWLVIRGYVQPFPRRQLVDGVSPLGWAQCRAIVAVTAKATTRDRARNHAPVRVSSPYYPGEADWFAGRSA